jgi:ankyrin repeat protein
MLQNLPIDLTETYDRLLSRLVGRQREQLIQRMFEWIICSKRPLHIDELQEAIAFSISDSFWDATKIPNDMSRLIRACGNLVVVDEETSNVNFAHYTVEQYLLSRPVLTGSPMPFSLHQANIAAAEVCLAYLSFSDFETQVTPYLDTTRANMAAIEELVQTNSLLPDNQLAKAALSVWNHVRPRPWKVPSTSIDYSRHIPKGKPPTTTLLGKYKLLAYVLDFWLVHTGVFGPELDEETATYTMFEDIIHRKNFYFPIFPWSESSSWTKGMLTVAQIGWAMENNHSLLSRVLPITDNVHLLHRAAAVIFSAADVPINPENNERLNASTGFYPSSPDELPFWLYAKFLSAIKRGHLSICTTFLCKADSQEALQKFTFSNDIIGGHLLTGAAMHGQTQLVEMLVLQVKEITTFTFHDMYFNPLELAAFHGHRGVVRLLLWKGSHLSSCRPNYGLEKLVEAVNYGNTRVVQALEIALFGGKVKDEITSEVKALISHEFSRACADGNLRVARVLLKHIHYSWLTVGPAFTTAIMNDHTAILALIAGDCWPDIPSTDKKILLQKSARLGCGELVKLFFDRRADAHQKHWQEPLMQPPLLAAASSGNIAMVKFLLEHSLLSSMIEPDDMEYAFYLLFDAPLAIGGSACKLPAIYQAATLGDFTAVDVLIRAGAVRPPYEVTLATHSREILSPLGVALAKQHWLVARRLVDTVLGLEPGSPWGVEDTEPWEPNSVFDVAASCNNKPVLKLLHESGFGRALCLTDRNALA